MQFSLDGVAMKFYGWITVALLAGQAQAQLTGYATSDYEKEKVQEYDRKIQELEHKYLALEGRRTFKKSAKPSVSNTYHSDKVSLQGPGSMEKQRYRVDRHLIVENCFISVATKVYDTNDALVQQELGPINLRKVTKMRNIDHSKGTSLGYQISFDTSTKDLPELIFHSRQKRAEAFTVLDELRYLCQERYDLARRLNIAEFSGINDQHRHLDMPVSKETFARPVRTLKEDPTQKAALLTNGEKAWIGRLKINELAKGPGDSIKLQTLIFMADEAGLHWSDDLIERRRKGVTVELLIDALSPFLDIRDLTVHDNTKRMYHNMMAAGIPVHGYRCGSHHRLLDEIFLSIRVGNEAYNQRPHEKIWIVNKQQAIVGGLNIGNDYFRLNKPGYGFWRDQDIYIKGNKIIQDFINIFDGNTASYVANYKDPRTDSCFNPHDPIKEAIAYERFYMKNRREYDLKRRRSKKREHQAYARSRIREFERLRQVQAEPWTLQFHHLKKARAVHNRPKLKELHIENALLSVINNATREVLISNSYFIPSLQIKKALRRAAKRGVRVMILTNSYKTNDVPPVAMLGRHSYKELVDYNYGRSGKSGSEVEIYEWTGESSANSKMEQGTNHAKFLVADSKIAFIGSYNLDPRSREINSEVGLLFESKSLAGELAKEFHDVDLRFAKRVGYDEMIDFRQPVHLLEAFWLKLKGGYKDFGLSDVGKKRFFYHIARYDESTW